MPTMSIDKEELTERVVAALRAHPAVARLDAGLFGVVATYLPGRRVTGVRVPDDDSAVEVSVALWTGHAVPDAARDIRALVRAIAGDVRVDVTVTDLVDPADPADPLADAATTPDHPAPPGAHP